MNYRMSALIPCIVLFCAFAVPFAAASDFTETESRDILARVDALVSFDDSDFSAEYTITQERPGQGASVTRTTMFRRDRVDSYTILIMEPAVDRGKGYLRRGNTLSLYDPADGRWTTTSARDRFQNTNARNSDFTQSTLAEDYRIVDHTTEQLGAFATDVYDLEAITDDVSFPRMRIWIDENELVRKFEDYSLSGQHMRTTAIPSYRRLGDDTFVPVRIVIQDELRGRTVDGRFRNERTIISVERPSLQSVPDMVFSRAFLERTAD
ncbi:MAG: outer membrane lipoprotein-sorting protein [Spirochaetaceae bacterium]